MDSRAPRRENGAYKSKSECTDWRIQQLTIPDYSSKVRDTRRRLPPEAGRSVSTQTIRDRLKQVQLRSRVPAAGVPLTTQHRIRHFS
ncbi:hypothetical protein TNCV_717191 [Trichonephila clavipes]|nr:hypothetical protein TNCV_717191 [Trichonephila clavipes]